MSNELKNEKDEIHSQTSSYASQNNMNTNDTAQLKNNRNNGPTTREWSAGLFDCLVDLKTCVQSCFCPCVTYAQNKAIINSTGSIYPDVALYCCGIDFACCGAVAAIGASTRADLRKQRRIEGSFLTDCLTHYLCYSCALTQEKLECDAIKND
ncbi:PLAC8 family-domain-containing protein [Globomyces pollinis-pini]|nr:PLAC8 family-domain-containing protein [Globomyces pollinis-pini]